MKRLVAFLLAIVFAVSLCACGNTPSNGTGEQNKEESAEAASASKSSAAETSANESESDTDSTWSKLERLGKIETENGVFYVSITLPADFVDEDVTQESLDAEKGEEYTSAKLNDDGSVTYRMTKAQHRAMLQECTENIDSALKELVDDEDFAIASITHNDTFTEFNVHLDTEEVGMAEGFAAIALYMFGGLYSTFSGETAETVAVNYYSASGNLIKTADSSEMS